MFGSKIKVDRNKSALTQIARGLAWMAYAGAVAFGDIMFIQIMNKAYPTGVLGMIAMFGSVMTAVTAITLPLAMHHWFSPGIQFISGVIFWSLDIVILILNSILAFQYSSGVVDPILLVWAEISPASPLFSVIGWGVIMMLDSDQKMNMAVREAVEDGVDKLKDKMRTAMDNPEVDEQMADIASAVTQQFMDMVGAGMPSGRGRSGGRSASTPPFEIHEAPMNRLPQPRRRVVPRQDFSDELDSDYPEIPVQHRRPAPPPNFHSGDTRNRVPDGTLDGIPFYNARPRNSRAVEVNEDAIPREWIEHLAEEDEHEFGRYPNNIPGANNAGGNPTRPPRL